MKICDVCNTSLDDIITYCPNCGNYVEAGYPTRYQKKSKDPISVGGWIGRSLIPFIPLVGGLVYLIMLFIWSGDTKKEITFRNWAKAQLILTAIGIILAIIFFVIASIISADLISTFSTMMA